MTFYCVAISTQISFDNALSKTKVIFVFVSKEDKDDLCDSVSGSCDSGQAYSQPATTAWSADQRQLELSNRRPM